MKVSVVRGGGVAGLVTTTEVDSESMAAPEAEELRARVDESGVRELANRDAGDGGKREGSRGADLLSLAVTVEDEHGAQTVRLGEEALPRGIRSLIAWVDSAPGRSERVGGRRRGR